LKLTGKELPDEDSRSRPGERSQPFTSAAPYLQLTVDQQPATLFLAPGSFALDSSFHTLNSRLAEPTIGRVPSRSERQELARRPAGLPPWEPPATQGVLTAAVSTLFSEETGKSLQEIFESMLVPTACRTNRLGPKASDVIRAGLRALAREEMGDAYGDWQAIVAQLPSDPLTPQIEQQVEADMRAFRQRTQSKVTR
jgi:hypothetical protein